MLAATGFGFAGSKWGERNRRIGGYDSVPPYLTPLSPRSKKNDPKRATGVKYGNGT
jgi:hypothetical protein